MAKSSKKTGSKSSTPSKKAQPSTRDRADSRDSGNPRKNPRRREILAAVFFVLAIFSFIGFWNSDGVFIGFFINIIKGLVGAGYFALAPALLLCTIILTFHRGRPILYRTVCTLLLPISIGALVHLFSNTPDYDISFAMIAALWTDGRALVSGGVISGSLSELFSWLFADVGAIIVFICMTLFLLMSSLNKTIVGFVDAVRNRQRREYIPDPADEATPVYAQKPPKPPRPNASAERKKPKNIDIPLDDEEPLNTRRRKSEKENFFNTTSDVNAPNNAPYGEDSDENDESDELEDVPLNIPFMEARRKGRGIVPPPPEGKGYAPPVDNAENPRGGKKNASSAQPKTPSDDATAGNPAVSADNAKTAETHEPITINTNTGSQYTFPPLELLSAGKSRSKTDGRNEVLQNSDRLEAAFASFGVNVNITNATRGPAVTRYEAELEPGVKLNKLTGLADDIALSLGTSGVRIAAMPNMISTVGIEVPNKIISVVYLRDIIKSTEFSKAKSKLTFAIGMDISGEAIVGNIAKLPHLLVAGTTGSGKSVCLNSIILSILYNATPDDVRFIMIDPKMVEFKVYNSIPHLLVPVVTDVKKAAGALQWAVVEMMKRYKLFAETNSRDLEGYNKAVHKLKSEDLQVLPQVVVIIDELADLMMTAAREVEESICRVAQMGRAAGVHLVIATQSPRADVITGLMKANIPSRISFRVSSALESRIILDAGGNADKLVGNGDMLYAPIGAPKPMRIQGTWVSDAERERVVEFINNSGETQYSEEVMSEIEKAAAADSGGKSGTDPGGDDYDELLPQAVDVIFETGQASVSMLQRRLKLGFSRAARIVDQMEQMGIVGPYEGSKPRALLITKDEWRQKQYVTGNAPQDTLFDLAEYNADDNDE